MNESVIVTGASTGIGHASALHLAKAGFVVFAGVRNDADAARLRGASERINPLLLDVTNAHQISDAAKQIENAGFALRGVVNNAGIAVAGPLEYIALDALRAQFEVNLFGTIAVTQAMLPLLRRSLGRIVFVSSVSGRIAPPFIGAYAASKFALEAAADSMRMELAPFGIAVSVVQPGNVNTPIWAKGRAAKPAMMAQLPPEAIERYGHAFDALEKLTQSEERTGIDSAIVAGAIAHALIDARPRARYIVGAPPAWQRMMASVMPERFRDKMIMRNFDK